MKISICFRGYIEPQAPLWMAELQQALPESNIKIWEYGDSPADYAVTWLEPQEFIDAQPQLKAILTAGAGVESILKLQLPSGLPVIRVEDCGMAAQMIEYISYGVIRFFRGFATYERQQQEQQWSQLGLRSYQDFPIGVLGLGVLGQKVAHALQKLGFTVAGWSRTAKRDLPFESFSGEQGLGALLAKSRILVCLLPLTPQTKGIINSQTLGQLLPDAYIINVARGAHIVQSDLFDALDNGTLAGVMMDVFEKEPLAPDHPYWLHPKITITPHIAALTSRGESVKQIAQKIKRLEQGLPVTGVVSREQGY